MSTCTKIQVVRQGQALINLLFIIHFRNNDPSPGIRFLIYTARTSIPAVHSAVAKFLVPDCEDIVDRTTRLQATSSLHSVDIFLLLGTIFVYLSMYIVTCRSEGHKELSSILADQMSPTAEGGEEVTGSQPVTGSEYSCEYGAQKKSRNLTLYLSYGLVHFQVQSYICRYIQNKPLRPCVVYMRHEHNILPN
jgi:hypothetical protein